MVLVTVRLIGSFWVLALTLGGLLLAKIAPAARSSIHAELRPGTLRAIYVSHLQITVPIYALSQKRASRTLPALISMSRFVRAPSASKSIERENDPPTGASLSNVNPRTYGPGVSARMPAIENPPSTVSVCPVTKLDSLSFNRKTAALATSFGVPYRRCGTVVNQAARISAVCISETIGVSIGPGAMAFTRTPNGANSTAITLVKVTMPPLEAP